jgi:hypothetical protein
MTTADLTSKHTTGIQDIHAVKIKSAAILAVFLLLISGWLSPFVSPASAIDDSPASLFPAPVLPGLGEFVGSVRNGSPDTLVGVYASGVLALPVVQQPANNPAFVSPKPGVLTQFEMASEYGSTGILAHNTLSGEEFTNFKAGQDVVLVFGDGTLKRYRISGTGTYQALSPRSPYSEFIDLEKEGARLSAADLFYKIYAQKGRLVFQTCIEANGDVSWGRLFVIAEPIKENIASLMRFHYWKAVPE